MTKMELHEIRQQLECNYCNPIWRQTITALTREIDRLYDLLSEKDPLRTDSPEMESETASWEKHEFSRL